MSTLISLERRIARTILTTFRQRGAVGKVLMLGVGLLLSCCLCSIPILVVPAPTPTAVAEDGLDEEELALAQATATAQAVTDTPAATDTPTATDTPVVTDTPAATAAPAPTNTVGPTSTNVPTAQTTAEASETPQPTAAASATSAATAIDEGVPAGDTATVVGIIDGDTIDVQLDGQVHRVRYIGMDTPERGDPFFDEATEANRELVEGRQVILVKDVSETDRFDRLLRYVYLPDGTFVNAELVRRGFAQVATFPPDVLHVDLFTQLQGEARAAGLGLWAGVANAPAPTDAPQRTAVPIATDTPAGEPPAPSSPQVVISNILYDGVEGRNEPDEYAVITNQGGSVVNLDGWRLNAGAQGQDFYFPPHELAPGQSCRVYTNQAHPETCGFSLNRGQALWNNGGDCGYLYDSSGVEVSRYCY